jgi:hypothetical protein
MATATGPRQKDHPQNIEGSGYHYGDKVIVNSDNKEVNGIVEAIHQNGRKIDVRIDHPRHSSHGRVETFTPDEVRPHPDLAKQFEGRQASTAKG